MYKQITGLKGSGSYTMGYADDIAILISRKFPSTISELLQVLGMVEQWCDRAQLSIKPQKINALYSYPFIHSFIQLIKQHKCLKRIYLLYMHYVSVDSFGHQQNYKKYKR